MSYIAKAQYELGQRTDAIQNAQASLAICEEVGDPLAEELHTQLQAWINEENG